MLGTDFLGDCHLDNPVNLSRINHSLIEDVLYEMDEDVASKIIKYDEVSDIAKLIKNKMIKDGVTTKINSVHYAEYNEFERVLNDVCMEYVNEHRKED